MHTIDLRSDTVTHPTPAMRDAMARADVGDDVYGDDPTVNLLEETAAGILGKEAALFVTSGTMGNQLAIMSQTQRGDEIIVSDQAHIFEHEVGAAAVLSGVNQRQLPFPGGFYDAGMIERAIRSSDIHVPRTAMICLENALSNGRVVPLETMRACYAVGQAHGIAVHLDGARIFNAAVSLGVPVAELTRACDTVSCCLSKGLCAPVGSVLAGPRDVIARARKYRKMLGGGMRQAGILAAAGLIAIREMPQRLHEDHANARHLAELLGGLPGVTVDINGVDINMVFFDVDRPNDVLDRVEGELRRRGIKVNGHDNGRFRFVTNRDVSREDLGTVVEALSALIG